jgi:hypothetical protein
VTPGQSWVFTPSGKARHVEFSRRPEPAPRRIAATACGQGWRRSGAKSAGRTASHRGDLKRTLGGLRSWEASRCKAGHSARPAHPARPAILAPCIAFRATLGLCLYLALIACSEVANGPERPWLEPK